MKTVVKSNQMQRRVSSHMRWSSDRQTAGDTERRPWQWGVDWGKHNGRVLADQDFADRGVSGWKGANRQSGAYGALLKTAQEGDTILIRGNVHLPKVKEPFLPSAARIFPEETSVHRLQIMIEGYNMKPGTEALVLALLALSTPLLQSSDVRPAPLRLPPSSPSGKPQHESRAIQMV